ncbi:MAG TPA: prepilin-type N-terminal cleavage/methylation domain-containing protein [Bryobacteraceae bacterium]|nr:prepilin-type N-terminal cleavage/methylation domain-containing protein [Bryobacteraceae bacterium]
MIPLIHVRGPVSEFSRAARVSKRTGGFTLIELLIAVTLVAAISTGMLFAMRSALITYSKTDDRLQSNRRVMSVERILGRELGGVMPVMGVCADNSIMPAFNGNAQTLHFVTSYSMRDGARGYPQVVELQVLPADGGGVRLIANEFPYSGPYATAPLCAASAFRPGVATPQSFVLADRLAYCNISYQNFDPSLHMPTNWQPLWTAVNLPAAVHVDMAPLIPDPARLPLVSVTTPIHVNRDVNTTYYDIPQ